MTFVYVLIFLLFISQAFSWRANQAQYKLIKYLATEIDRTNAELKFLSRGDDVEEIKNDLDCYVQRINGISKRCTALEKEIKRLNKKH